MGAKVSRSALAPSGIPLTVPRPVFVISPVTSAANMENAEKVKQPCKAPSTATTDADLEASAGPHNKRRRHRRCCSAVRLPTGRHRQTTPMRDTADGQSERQKPRPTELQKFDTQPLTSDVTMPNPTDKNPPIITATPPPRLPI
ncbi:hypothetical protein GCM10010297_17950 [Streptomyces malachitofuscus]|nr:hypothetical protein GCM10010297_17950 [Streptomyces malachitofuscus]